MDSNNDGNGRDGGRRLRVLAVRKFERSGFEKEHFFIAVDDILYIFSAGAVSSTRRYKYIDAGWTQSLSLPDGKVYARTADGVFVTMFDALDEILKCLDGFLRIHNSIALNETKIKGAILNARTKQIVVLADQGREWLKVGRRRLAALEKNFGIVRHPRTPKTNPPPGVLQ